MSYFALVWLFILVGSVSTQDKSLETFIIFVILSVIILIVINLAGILFIVNKLYFIVNRLHFVQSNLYLTQIKPEQLNHHDRSATAGLVKRLEDFSGEIRKLGEGTKNNFSKIVSSIYEFSTFLRPILAP